MARANKKYAMNRMRVTWVLAALLASMTLGTVVLGVLEPSGKMLKNAKGMYLRATFNSDLSTKTSNTSVPVENDLWQAVVIHTTRNISSDDLSSMMRREYASI